MDAKQPAQWNAINAILPDKNIARSWSSNGYMERNRIHIPQDNGLMIGFLLSKITRPGDMLRDWTASELGRAALWLDINAGVILIG